MRERRERGEETELETKRERKANWNGSSLAKYLNASSLIHRSLISGRDILNPWGCHGCLAKNLETKIVMDSSRACLLQPARTGETSAGEKKNIAESPIPFFSRFTSGEREEEEM